MRSEVLGSVLLGLSLLSASCGGRVRELSPDEVDETGSMDPQKEECTPRLSERLLKHVCTHTDHGPFTSVVATGDAQKMADVSRLHATYDVTVTALPVRLTYDASRQGSHVLLTSAPVEWRVDSEGIGIEGTLPATGGSCDGTTSGRSFQVNKGERVVLLANQAPEHFTLFIEHVATFGDDALACVDGS